MVTFFAVIGVWFCASLVVGLLMGCWFRHLEDEDGGDPLP